MKISLKKITLFFSYLFCDLLILLITFYQKCLSPWMAPRCRFQPTCSSYAKEALITKGFFKGMLLIFIRLLKCHPWHQGGYDPIKHSETRSL